MTTPAVDQNLNQTVNLLEDWRYGSGSTGSWQVPITIRRSHDLRPASVTNPVVPGYKSLRYSGAYYRSVTRGTYNGGMARMDWDCVVFPFTLVYWGFQGTFWGNTLNEGPPPFQSSGWHDANSIMEAKEQLLASPVNFGVMLAEVKETSELVGSAAMTIARQVQAFRRTRDPEGHLWRQVRRAVRPSEIPKRWLELQYGWKPLMSDVAGACDALSRNVSDRKPLEFVKGKSHSKDISVRRVGGGPSSYGSDCWLDLVTEKTIGAKTDLIYRLRDPTLATFSSLGLVNPALIVWEKVPYSFVVDWFLPIGGWLNSAGADAGWDFITGSTTNYAFIKKRIENVRYGSTNPCWRFSGSNPTLRWTNRQMQRRVHSSSPVPGLQFNPEPLSLTRLANGLSLLAQAFR